MKKKVLIYISGVGYGCLTGQHLDMAITEREKGNDVFLLNCDSSVGLCVQNPMSKPLFCGICSYFQKVDMNRYAPEGVEQHWMREYVRNIDKTRLPKFEYSSAKELKSLNYRGVEIGYGVLSTYISATRNLNPEINEKSRIYFDALIEQQLIILEILERLQKEHQFDLFIFQNGRGAQVRPFLNFCQREKIDFWCTEDMGTMKPVTYINNFWNDIPHSITQLARKYEDCWNSSSESWQTKTDIAKSFFENRRKAIPAGDKVYVGDQVEGLLPNDWDTQKENIVIFNSSEDEYASIGRDFDNYALIPTQLENIKIILDHYKDDTNKLFTLRIHPNLKKVPYRYHIDLYKLSYPNLRIISANSPISSYSLMDAADKVIVFGSSMGLEASYWQKPVICLRGAIYLNLGIVYHPKTMEELWGYIDNRNLPALSNEGALKYAYFYQGDNHETTKHVCINRYKKNILGKNIVCMKFQKLFGSNFLYGLFVSLLNMYIKNKLPSRFKEIPQEEE